uniref:Mannose receptor, C type 1b n=1 Tax=Monopterus albus TaxID=43700 RepID=A0A3Q3K3C2_MONAL
MRITYSPFQLTNKASGFCLIKTNNHCDEVRWTTGDRLLVQQKNKCLGAQGKSVGSEISLYDCDENNELQKWECKNETVLALQGQELYIELTGDNTAVLSKTLGPNNHLTISGTSSGACTRTYRELYVIGGNGAGKPCMFPFLYKDQWYSNCTTDDSSEKHLWCAVETKYQNERWGYCPTASRAGWNLHPITGVYYQLNTQSALTWPQAELSCKQQGASLLSITDPHEQAYVTGKSYTTGCFLQFMEEYKTYQHAKYNYFLDLGHPLPNPGYICAIVDATVQFSWQSSPCSKKLGYICYSKEAEETPTQSVHTSFCSSPWMPYNGHCFHLNHTQKTWSDAQRQCRYEGGDLVSIRNVEDQSFVISQLGYASRDELWIGLNDRKTERLFDWSDHSTVSFTSWEFGKPAVSTDIRDCVLIRGEKGNWVDRVCEEKHGFICMKMSTSQSTGDEVAAVAEPGCKTGWRRHGSYCYFIGTETKTFDEAKDDCKSSGSYLADVSTGVDNAFLVSLVGMRSEKYFWLGLSNQKDIAEFGCVAMKTGVFAGLWDVLPCTNKEKYICKHLALGVELTPVPPTFKPLKCADAWTSVGSRNYCFKLFSVMSANKKTWYEARDYCRAIGGDLLSIHTIKEAWIGLSAPDPTTGYVWSDGSPLNFQHWEDGEPNNFNNVESCAEINLEKRDSSGSWNDVHCETFHNWMCQIRAGKTTELIYFIYNKTSDGWLIWNGTQYYINTRTMPNEEARHFCQQRHGDLVTISSEAESVFLWKQISRGYGSYWIGLNVDLDGTFSWMDGSPVVFQRWDENQPEFQNNDENCAAMTISMGFWHDYNCGFEHRSICKRSASIPANTTVAPTVPPRGGCPQSWKKFNSKVRDYSTICYIYGILYISVFVFLSTQMAEAPTIDLWIGLHNTHGGSFYWTDGRPMRYTNWGSEVSGYSFFYFKVIEPTTPTDYIKMLNDSIKVVSQNMTWEAARKNCETDGANLASLRNEWSKLYVELMALNLQTPLWIGLNKLQTNGYFRYVDGWHMTLSNWGTAEPSMKRPCVYVDVDGKWKTADCTQNMSSICMKSTDMAPTESSEFPGVCPEDGEMTTYTRQSYSWLPYKGYCYLFLTEKIEWPDASTSCSRHGKELRNSFNDSSILLQLNIRSLTKDKLSGLWQWLDKTVMDYVNWDVDQPDINPYGVIQVSNGKWNTGNRWRDRGYVCKTPKGEVIILISS